MVCQSYMVRVEESAANFNCPRPKPGAGKSPCRACHRSPGRSDDSENLASARQRMVGRHFARTDQRAQSSEAGSFWSVARNPITERPLWKDRWDPPRWEPYEDDPGPRYPFDATIYVLNRADDLAAFEKKKKNTGELGITALACHAYYPRL